MAFSSWFFRGPIYYAAYVLPQIADAQTATEEHIVEHVLVTVPFQQKEAETALPITLITDEEIKEQSTATLGESLIHQPGLSNASFGPGVGQPVIRGQQGARVAVLQNSLAIGDASNVSADHTIATEAVLASKIEVLRGPSTLLYGSGAIGGVVNVIDNRIPTSLDRNEFEMELRHGSASHENVGVVRGETNFNRVAVYAGGMHRGTSDMSIPGFAQLEEDEHNTHGFVPNTDATTNSATIGGSYIFDKGLVGLAYNSTENDYGIPPGAHEHEEHHDDEEEEGHEEEELEEGEEPVRIDLESERYDFRFSYNQPFAGISSIDWKTSSSRYQHIESEGDENGTTFSNDLWQNRVQLVHEAIGDWHGVIGIQQSHSDFSAIGEESFIPESEIDKVGLFVLENWHNKYTSYELGLRVDEIKIDTQGATNTSVSFQPVSFSASSLFHFSDALHLGLALSHSERSPTVEELMSNSETSSEVEHELIVHAATNTIEVGDIDLDLESANNVDLSLSWHTNNIEGFVTVFFNQFSDFIFLENTGITQDEIRIFEYSQADANFLGIETELNIELSSQLYGRLFADYIRGELDDGENLPRIPSARIGGSLEYSLNNWKAKGSVLHSFKQDKTTEFEDPTDSYTRIDTSINYHLFGIDDASVIFVRVKNVSDEEIRSHTSFLKGITPEAGRSIEMGLRLSFQ